MKNNNISLRQFNLLFLMGALSLCFQFFSPWIKDTGNSAWLLPIIGFVTFIPLAFLYSGLIKKSNARSYDDMLGVAYGKIASKILLAIYFIYLTFLAAIFTRYYAERLLALVIVKSSLFFTLLLFVALIYMLLRGGIVPLARFCELSLLFLGAMFLVLFALILFDVEPLNLTPIAFPRAGGIPHSILGLISIYSLLLLPLFFAGNLARKKGIARKMLTVGAVLSLFSALLSALIVGVLNAPFAQRLSFAFFILVKNISILAPIGHLEPLVLAIWIFMDFLTVALFALSASRAFGTMIGCPFFAKSPERIKHLQKSKDFLLLVYCAVLVAAAIYCFPDFFYLERVTQNICPYINAALFIILPAITLLILHLKEKKTKARELLNL